MLIIVMLAIALSLSVAQPEPLCNLGYLSLAAVALYWAVAAIMGRCVAVMTIKTVGQFLPRLQRRLIIVRSAAQLWLVGGSVLVVTLGLADLINHRWGMGNWPIVPKLLVLTPFIAALFLFWIQEYPGYCATRGRHILIAQQAGPAVGPLWTLRQYLSYNARHHLLFVFVPIALILLCQDLLVLAANSYAPNARYLNYITSGGGILCAVGVFIIAPAIIVRLWRTTTMPQGELLDGLLAISKKMKLRFRKLLIWQTGNMIVNACVMGVCSPIRYVLLSDELVGNMDKHEVEAVFAHEAGHIVHHHILYCGLFAATSIGIAICLTELAMRLMDMDSQAGEILTMGVLVLLWTFAFGWISKRFERQSDVTAAWVMGRMPLALTETHLGTGLADAGELLKTDDAISPIGAAIFARALEKVAQLSGVSLLQRNWRHGSIAWRVEYIIYLGSTGGGRGQIDCVVGWIKVGLWITFVLAVLGVVLLSI